MKHARINSTSLKNNEILFSHFFPEQKSFQIRNTLIMLRFRAAKSFHYAIIFLSYRAIEP